MTALFSYINYRWLRMPNTIGLMAMSMVLSLALIGLNAAGLDIETHARGLIKFISFEKLLLHGMLGVLLFAGALHVDLAALADNKWQVGILATVGVLASTFIVGLLVWALSHILGLNLQFLHCLIFGSLISPTDPISVLAILRKVGAPESLEIKITGESLFNDGIGVVIFLTLLAIMQGGSTFGAGQVASMFAAKALGGLGLGLALGYLTYLLLRSVDNYQVEVLLTLALVVGGYTLAEAIHTSGPIAMVVAGLLVGNHGRRLAMSDTTREHLDMFWLLMDDLFNAILFVLIGFEVLLLSFQGKFLLAGVIAIPLVLLSRLISVGLPVMLMKFHWKFYHHAIRIMTWGGLRGGISVALALSLPASFAGRELIVTMTYVVVAFSILVQGLTIRKMVERSLASGK